MPRNVDGLTAKEFRALTSLYKRRQSALKWYHRNSVAINERKRRRWQQQQQLAKEVEKEVLGDEGEDRQGD